MKYLLKTVKIIGIFIIGLVLITTLAGFLMSKDLPEGTKGPEADQLAQQILTELNYQAYQKTEVISWTFAGLHSYEWHKNEHFVFVNSDDYKVKLDLKNYDKSEILFSNDMNDKTLIETSIKNFNNDSFWLIAPYKIMENNVERRLVTSNNGENSLLVTYTSGGTTPGDSYLWNVDENYRPVSFRMWVSILPVGGLKAKWKDWEKTQSGMILSTKKTVFGIPIEITNLETSP